MINVLVADAERELEAGFGQSAAAREMIDG